MRIGGTATGELDDRAITRLRHRVIGFIFQNFNLIPVLNVYENIEFPLLLGRTAIPREARRAWIDELIEAVGLGRSGGTTSPTSCPADSASGWPSPAPW